MKYSIILNLALTVALLSSACQQDSQEVLLHEFELHPDFKIELIAMEPVVLDPVDLLFDASGDLYVLEMPGYPFGDQQSRIVLLVDEDLDGYYEKRNVVCDSLHQATSFLKYKAGFLAAAPPHILYLTDLDGDGTFEHREVLLTGFADGNLQHNINGLTYGLDNWIYGANGGNGGVITWTGQTNDEAVKLGAGDFRMDMSREIFERSGRSSGGFEIAVNEWGHYFGTHNLHHIRQVVIPERYYRNQYMIPRHALTHISDHEEDGLARIFAIGQQHTRVNHPEQSGYFSGACGIEYYGGSLFPEAFRGNIFVADVVLNLVHRDVLVSNGTVFQASRGRENVEFLASTDRAFRPVNIYTAPNGALYVCDMHREVIEHPEWIPDEIEETIDLNAGKDQGRIYRIVPRDQSTLVPCTFDKENLSAIMSALISNEQACRLLAQEMIVSHQITDMIPMIRQNLSQLQSAVLANALWTLAGLRNLTTEDVKYALMHSDARIQEQGLLLAESFVMDRSLWPQVKALIGTEDDRLNLQAILSAGIWLKAHPSIEDEIINLLAQVRNTDRDVWVSMAMATVFNQSPLKALQAMAATSQFKDAQSLWHTVGLRLGQTEVRSLDVAIDLAQTQIVQTTTQAALLRGITEGLRLGERKQNPRPDLSTLEGHSAELDLAVWQLQSELKMPVSTYAHQRISIALQAVADRKQPLTDRKAHLTALSFGSADSILPALLQLISPDEHPELQLAAINQLQELYIPAVGTALIERWSKLGPTVRRTATDILIHQKHNHLPLLDAIEKGHLTVAEFNFDLERRRRLLFSENPQIRDRAEALFSDAGVVTRADALQQMQPALTIPASANAGDRVFTLQCAQCHTFKKTGYEVGPDLSECNRMSKETLLHHILDPNAVAEPSYVNHIIELHDGLKLSGILESESADGITIRVMGGQERVISRQDIKSLVSTGKSYMPEGLEAQMTTQEMADLLAYLQRG